MQCMNITLIIITRCCGKKMTEYLFVIPRVLCMIASIFIEKTEKSSCKMQTICGILTVTVEVGMGKLCP